MSGVTHRPCWKPRATRVRHDISKKKRVIYFRRTSSRRRTILTASPYHRQHNLERLKCPPSISSPCFPIGQVCRKEVSDWSKTLGCRTRTQLPRPVLPSPNICRIDLQDNMNLYPNWTDVHKYISHIQLNTPWHPPPPRRSIAMTSSRDTLPGWCSCALAAATQMHHR